MFQTKYKRVKNTIFTSTILPGMGMARKCEENFNLLVVLVRVVMLMLEGKPGDHENQLILSSGDKELLKYLNLNLSDGPTQRPRDPLCPSHTQIASFKYLKCKKQAGMEEGQSPQILLIE